MKNLHLASLAAFAAALLCAPAFALTQPPVGSVSTNQAFAVRSGTTFTASSLDAYEGKILVLMLMTPWCPYCQSNTIAVGDGILDFFNASSRGTKRGQNDQGIPISSLMLSTEPASNWDTTNTSFSAAQGFQQWGLDAATNRSNPRVLLGYYRGGYISSSNLYDWGEDRRRVIVLNLVKNSASHQYREIILNQNAFDSSHAASARTAINAIRPAPALTTYAQWAATRALPAATNGAQHDPDGDGASNLLEFFHGTDPLAASASGVGTRLESTAGGVRLVYQRAKNLGGVAAETMVSSDLINWSVQTGLVPTVTDAGTVEQIAVALPASAAAATFYRLRISSQ